MKYLVPGASGKPSPRLNYYLSLGEGLPDAPGTQYITRSNYETTTSYQLQHEAYIDNNI